MKFRSTSTRSRVDHLIIAIAIHAVSLLIAVVAVYWSITSHSLWPLCSGGLVLLVLEVLWLRQRLRK